MCSQTFGKLTLVILSDLHYLIVMSSILTSNSLSSNGRKRCCGMISLNPFWRERNWASMPRISRHWTYNLEVHECYEHGMLKERVRSVKTSADAPQTRPNRSIYAYPVYQSLTIHVQNDKMALVDYVLHELTVFRACILSQLCNTL